MNPKQIEEFFHLSPIQKHLLRQSEQALPPTHVAQFTCQFDGPLDAPALERAWQKVTNRQPGLRMTFVSGDLKEPVQVVNRNVSVALEKHDWRNLATEDQERRWQELLQADRQTSFVLKTAPLWHMALIRFDETRHRFVWTYHELLFDERSLPLLFNEAMECYEAILQGKNSPLPLPVSWRKYVEWGKKQDAAMVERFWRNYLQGFRTPTPLPLTLPETTVQLATAKAGTLHALAAQQYLAPEVIAYGAWALLLSRLSGQMEVVFGVQVSGRSSPFHGAERLIGHLRNIIPLRVRIVPDAMVVEWLTELQKQWEELQHYSQASLAQIQSWSEVGASASLFASVVVFDGAAAEVGLQQEIAGLQIQYESLAAPNHFPLAVMIKERGAWELTGDVQITQLRSVLEQFAIAPQRRLAEVILPIEPPRVAAEPVAAPAPPVIPPPWEAPEEAEQGWVNWIKDQVCVPELFEERAARTPEAIAVQGQGRSLTYRELNARANQLARYLRKLNIAPSLPVGLCVVLSVESAVGVLGVLKAGGAYLPLDAAWSQAELQEIITDSATSVVLTLAELQPKFRRVPLHCIVLCLDSDWSFVAEEEVDNLACPVSDEHPACFLPPDSLLEADMPAVITHGRLAQTMAQLPEWFRFTPDNPWHLCLSEAPASAPAPEEVEVVEAFDNGELSELNRGMDWFDLTPETVLAETPTWEVMPNPDPDFAPEPVPDFVLEPEPEINLVATTEDEFELDVPLLSVPAPPTAPTPVVVAAPSNLSPIQQCFFAQQPAQPQHWNVSLLVESGDRLDPHLLQEALRAVVAHHDTLRWRFTETETGWRWQTQTDVTQLPFEYVDFSVKWARSQRKAIEDAADKWQASLHLSDGPLWRAVYFDLGADRSHRLLIIAHQLIADEASLRLFLTDWLTAYWQLRREHPLALPPPIASYQEWAQASADSASSEELSYWRQLETKALRALPIDHPASVNRYGQADRVFVSLNSKETETLLRHVPAAAEAEVNEIVLTALALALAQWAGENGMFLEIERDARQAGEVDVARTVGWFAAKFPLWLEVEARQDVVAALQAIKTQCRALPHNGFHYGWWRYHEAALPALPQPPVSYKYLDFPADETAWQVAPEAVGSEHHPANERRVLIAVTGAMNLNMLEFRWEYAREQFEQKNIGLLVNSFIAELRRLILHYSQHSAQSGD